MIDASNDKKKLEEQRKIPVWVICSIILLSIMISGLIICSFLLSENKFVITGSIISLLCLLVILILSNSFDYIHFGKYFELSKKMDEGNNKLKDLNSKSDELLRIVNINSQTLKNSSTVNWSLIIGNQTQVDKNEKDLEEKKALNYSKEKAKLKRLDKDLFNKFIFQNYSKKNKLTSTIQKDIKIEETFQNIDSISNKKVFFDGFFEENEKKIFIDILHLHVYMLYYDRLYVKLNKILAYKKLNGIDAKLLLLIPKGNEPEREYNLNFFNQNFGPAINNKLLEIEYVEYSEEDYKQCLKDRRKK